MDMSHNGLDNPSGVPNPRWRGVKIDCKPVSLAPLYRGVEWWCWFSRDICFSHLDIRAALY